MSDQQTAAAAPREMTDEELWNFLRAEFGTGRLVELCGWMCWMYLQDYRPAHTHALRQWFLDHGMTRATAHRAITDLCRLRELVAAAEGREMGMEELPASCVAKMRHPVTIALQ